MGDRQPAGALPLPAPVAVPVRAGTGQRRQRGRRGRRRRPSLTATGPVPAGAAVRLLLVLTTTPTLPAERRVMRHEVLLVLGVSLAASAIWSLLRLVERLTRGVPLAQQTAAMNVSRPPHRPWLDLAYRPTGILLALVPVLLALHLLNRRPGGAVRLIGLDPRTTDLLSGAGLAALIGLPGLGLYVVARYLGISVTIAPANLAAVWWAVPVLI